MEGGKHALPQPLEYVLLNCCTKNPDTNNYEKYGLFLNHTCPQKRMNHLKMVINDIIPLAD